MRCHMVVRAPKGKYPVYQRCEDEVVMDPTGPGLAWLDTHTNLGWARIPACWKHVGLLSPIESPILQSP